MASKKSVLIVQESMRDYRLPFFDGLRDYLSCYDISLHVAYGRADKLDGTRGDQIPLDWGYRTRVARMRLGSARLVYQRLKRVGAYDLVVVEHANRHATNYWLLARARAGMGPPVAFWGHGGNTDTRGTFRTTIESWLRTATARQGHWIFAYTGSSAESFRCMGVQESRITQVNNTIATVPLEQGDVPVRVPTRAVFLGSLDPTKRLDQLISIADAVAGAVPGFELVIAGDGPLRAHLLSSIATRRHIRFQGRVTGLEKMRLLQSSSLHIHPGRVGLSAVDTLSASTPMITSRDVKHSPEIDYLIDGVNAVILDEGSLPTYVNQITELMSGTRQRLGELAANAPNGVPLMDDMVANFGRGIVESFGLRVMSKDPDPSVRNL